MSSYLLTNSLVFWYDAGGRTSIPYMITEIGSYARYPIMIYPKILQFILLFGMIPNVPLIEGEIDILFQGIVDSYLSRVNASVARINDY